MQACYDSINVNVTIPLFSQPGSTEKLFFSSLFPLAITFFPLETERKKERKKSSYKVTSLAIADFSSSPLCIQGK